MKTLLVLVFTLGLCTCAHAVTNFIQNGDFETSDLSSWTCPFGTIETVGTNHACRLQGGGDPTLQQAFTTTVGTQYYVAADMALDPVFGVGSAAIIAVQDGVGGTTIGSRAISPTVGAPGGSPTPRLAFVFTATTTSTNLRFTSHVASVLIDNVVVYEITKSALAGRYSGRLAQTVQLAAPDLTKASNSEAAAARVTSDGLIVLITLPLPYAGVISAMAPASLSAFRAPLRSAPRHRSRAPGSLSHTPLPRFRVPR